MLVRRERARARAHGWITGAGGVVRRGVEQLPAVTRENTPRAARPAVRAAAVLAALAAVGPAAAGVAGVAAAAPVAADTPRTAVRGLAVPGDGCVRVGGDLPLEELGRIAREEGVGEAVRRGCDREAPPPVPPAPTPSPPPTPTPEPPPPPRTPTPRAPAPAPPEPAAPPASAPVQPTPSPSRPPGPEPSPTPSPAPSPSLRPLYHGPPPRDVDEGTSPVTRTLLFVAPAILAAAALGGSGAAARNRS